VGGKHLSEIELTEYADRDTAPSDLVRVEGHLRQCSLCRRALARVQEAASAASRVGIVSPPQDLRARVAAKAADRRLLRVTCPKAASLLHEHIDGSLSPALVGGVQRHLRECPRCQAEFVALSKAAQLVRSLPRVRPPARVRQAVQAAALGPAPPPRARRAVWLRPAVAAAAVAAGALLLALNPLHQPAQRLESVRVAGQPPAAQSGPVHLAAPVESAPGSVASRETEEEAPRAETRPVAATPHRSIPSPSPVATATLVAFKGPSPARVAPKPAAPEVTVPSALRALKAIAGSVSHDVGAQRAMYLEGERFSTLASEAMLARLPEPSRLPESGGDVSGGSAGHGPAASREVGPAPEENASGRSTSGSAEAAVLHRPLV
jgi:anti-sigma factor RsiW